MHIRYVQTFAKLMNCFDLWVWTIAKNDSGAIAVEENFDGQLLLMSGWAIRWVEWETLVRLLFHTCTARVPHLCGSRTTLAWLGLLTRMVVNAYYRWVKHSILPEIVGPWFHLLLDFIFPEISFTASRRFIRLICNGIWWNVMFHNHCVKGSRGFVEGDFNGPECRWKRTLCNVHASGNVT